MKGAAVRHDCRPLPFLFVEESYSLLDSLLSCSASSLVSDGRPWAMARVFAAHAVCEA